MVLKKRSTFLLWHDFFKAISILSAISIRKIDFVKISTSESRALLPGLRNCLLSPTVLLNPFVSEKRFQNMRCDQNKKYSIFLISSPVIHEKLLK
jgi:hypothetical protein